MAKKAVHELTVCPVTATEAAHELTDCPVMTKEAVYEHSDVIVMKAAQELSVCSIGQVVCPRLCSAMASCSVRTTWPSCSAMAACSS